MKRMIEKEHQLNSTCVVLVPLDQIETAQHVAQKHQLQAKIEHDPATAMAELCLLHLQCRTNQAWINSPPTPRLILIHTDEIPHVKEMIAAIAKYLPHAIISELRAGRLENIDQHQSIVDSIVDSPIIHSQPVNADELSMLLDDDSSEAEQ